MRHTPTPPSDEHPAPAERLTIAFATHEYPLALPPGQGGGLGVYVQSIAHALAKRGHCVHVVTCALEDQPEVAVDHGVTVHRVSRAAPDATDPEALKRYSRAVAERLSELDLRHQLDVVEFQEWAAEGWAFFPRADLLMSVRTQTPSWVVRGFEYGRGGPAEVRVDELERWPLERADLVTSPSRLAAERLAERWCVDSDAVVCWPNPVDTGTFVPPTRAGPAEPLRVLCVNRYTPLKGGDVFVRAAAQVHRTFPDAVFRMVGRCDLWDGRPAHEYLRELARSQGLPDYHLELPGGAAHSDLPGEYASADLCVNPSLYESYSYTTAEALACARPTILTDRQGIAEYLSSGDDALVVPARDVEALAEAMCQLLADGSVRGKIGNRACRTAAERLSTEVTAEAVECAYLRGLERVRNRPRPAPARLHVAVLAHNAVGHTRRCVESLLSGTTTDLRVWVLDNGSTDDTRRWLGEQSDSRVSPLLSDANVGVPGGRNRLTREILPYLRADDYVVFLDNDVTVSPGWDEHFLSFFASHPRVGIAGAAGHPFVVHEQHRQLLPPPTAAPFPADVVTGFCFWVRASTLRAVGLFDERLGRFWHEDDDYCVRALSYGHEVFVVPGAPLEHHEHKSGVANAEIANGGSPENQRYLADKWRAMGCVKPTGRVVRPAAMRSGKGRPVTVGVDARTLSHPSSASRGIGHYTAMHLLHAAAARPEWQFVAYVETPNLPPGAEALTWLPNIRFVLANDPSGADVDLTHLYDPMSMMPGYESPLRMFGSRTPLTATFYDLTPLHLYLRHWPEEAGLEYHERLAHIREGRSVLLTISESTKRDLTELAGVPSERVHTVYAGGSGQQAPPLSPEETEGLRHRLGIERPFFVHVGALDPHKNFDTTLAAWLRVRETHHVQLVVVGKRQDHLALYSEAVAREGLRDVLFVGYLDRSELEALYRDALGLVYLSRYEGFGLPVLESMANGCPVVTSEVSSLPEVAGDAALLVDPTDAEAASDAMIRLMEDPDLRDELVRRGAKRREIFTWERTAEQTIHVWERLIEDAEPVSVNASRGLAFGGEQPRTDAAPAVRWEGSHFVHTSLALANRELCLKLMDKGCELSLVPYEPDQFGTETDPRFEQLVERVNAPLERSAEVHVRQKWPPDFARPAEGKLVVFQPWEYGSLPRDWLRPLTTEVDEVWVYTNYLRECFLHSGVPESRVHVVPLGVDPQAFRPETPSMDLSDLSVPARGFYFLFVGGTIPRKGIDVLLKAYVEEFSSRDDVCLVVKDLGYCGQGWYEGQTAGEKIRALQGRPDAPGLSYVDRDLPPASLPALYAGCDCLVQPYRGEGFGLPIAEAMACGLPVVVTGHGAALDYAASETAYLIPATVRPFAAKRVGDIATVGYPWLAEPSVGDLKRLMRHVFVHRDEAASVGARASRHIRTHFTWERAADRALQRINALCGDTTEEASVDALLELVESERKHRNFAVALDHLRAATAVAPDSVDVLSSFGRLSLDIDDTDGARMALAQIERSHPGHPAGRQLAEALAPAGQVP